MRKFLTPARSRFKKFFLITFVISLHIYAILSITQDLPLRLLVLVFLIVFLSYQFHITTFLSFDQDQVILSFFTIKKKIPLKDILKVRESGNDFSRSRTRNYIITYWNDQQESELETTVRTNSTQWRQFRCFILRKNPLLEWNT